MPTNKNPIFVNSLLSKNLDFVNADGTAAETIVADGGDGSGVVKMMATTDDTSDVTVIISVNDGTLEVPIAEVLVAAGAGTDGGTTPGVNLLDAAQLAPYLQADGSLIVGANSTLRVAPKAAVSATRTLYISALVGSYGT